MLFANGPVSDVMKQVRQAIILNIRVQSDTDRAAKLLEQHDLVASLKIDDGTMIVQLKPGVLDYSDIPTQIIAAAFKLTLFREEELNLETAFMELTKGLVQ